MKILILLSHIILSIGLDQNHSKRTIDLHPNPNIRFDDPGLAFVMRKSLPDDQSVLSLYLDRQIYVRLTGDFSNELMLRIEQDWKFNKSYNPYMIASFTKQLTIRQYQGKGVCELHLNDDKHDVFRVSAGSDRLHFLIDQLDIIEVTSYLNAIIVDGCSVRERMNLWMNCVAGSRLVAGHYHDRGVYRKWVYYEADNHWEGMEFSQLYISEWNGAEWKVSDYKEQYSASDFFIYLSKVILKQDKS